MTMPAIRVQAREEVFGGCPVTRICGLRYVMLERVADYLGVDERTAAQRLAGKPAPYKVDLAGVIARAEAGQIIDAGELRTVIDAVREQTLAVVSIDSNSPLLAAMEGTENDECGDK